MQIELRELDGKPALVAFRTRFLILSAVVVGGYLPFVVRNHLLGFDRVALIQFVCCALIAGLIAFERTTPTSRWKYLAGHAVLACAMGSGFLGGMFTGQGGAVSAWVLPLGPLYAAYLLGRYSAAIWTVVCLLLLFVLHWSGQHHPLTPEFVASGWKVWGSQSVTTLVILLFGWGFRQGVEKQMGLLRARSLELLEAKSALSESYDSLRDLEQARQSFVELLVHDMRNPVTGVLGYAAMLKEDAAERLDESELETLDKIERLTQNLSDKLSNVLDLSRLEQTELTLRLELVDYRSLLMEVIGDFRAPKRAEIRLEEGPETILSCDRFLIRRVLENLFSNAQRYSPEDSVVTVSVVDRGDTVETRVTDQGPGIPLKQQARVFDRFFQSSPGAVKRSSGLGLALCRLAVEKHGGRMRLESVEGEGSAFSFRLPKRQPKALANVK